MAAREGERRGKGKEEEEEGEGEREGRRESQLEALNDWRSVAGLLTFFPSLGFSPSRDQVRKRRSRS